MPPPVQRHKFRFLWAGRTRRAGSCEWIVYVPYSGYFGDCGNYHGWVVGVDIDDPSMVSRLGHGSGRRWYLGPPGVASDGTNMFVITGNTFTNPGDQWSGGEAIVRLQAGPVFSGNPPISGRLPIGSHSTTAIPTLAVAAPYSSTCPTQTPSHLVLALGKDGNAYLLTVTTLEACGPVTR